MANYIASCRSNYVEIKKGKEAKFKELAEYAGFDVHEVEMSNGKTTYGLFNEMEGIPSVYSNVDFDDDTYEEIDWKDFAKCLVPGEVLHLTESGYEKMRYLWGSALFVRSDGRIKFMNIHDIPAPIAKFAKKHKRKISACQY